MSNKILLDKELVDRIYEDLVKIKNDSKDELTSNKLDKLLTFIEDNIIFNNKEYLNILKRIIYNKMKQTMYTNAKLNKELYKLYQELKTKNDYDYAVNRLEEINKLYNLNE